MIGMMVSLERNVRNVEEEAFCQIQRSNIKLFVNIHCGCIFENFTLMI